MEEYEFMELRDSRSLKVAYITQWFSPEPVGPAVWIAQALEQNGFEVSVITAVPNYPQGVVYPGYSVFRSRREVIHDIDVVRSPVYPSHDKSAMRRALNYMTFAVSSSWVGRKELKNADVVLVYASPQTAAIPALILRRWRGKPYVLIVQDLWPDSVLQTGFLNSSFARKIAQRLLGALDRVVSRNANQIIVIAPGMKQALVARGVPQEEITVMFNWADESVLFPRIQTGLLRRQLGISDDDLLFVYAGNHGSAQGLEDWINAIQAVEDLTDLHFVFIGDGAEKTKLEQMANSLRLKRIYFLDHMTPEEFARRVADCDAQIISLTDAPLFQITIPGKVQSSLALGSAMIASIAGDAAGIIDESGAGILASPCDQLEIENAIRQGYAEGQVALRKRGELGREYYLGRMRSAIGSTQLANVLRSAAATRVE
jgi:glycosyltransferase involved in cell wall biosynthesis